MEIEHSEDSGWFTQSEHFEPIFSVIIGESERGAVMLACHIIDDCMLGLIREHRPASVSSKSFREITSFNGPLGTLSGKSKTLHLLGVLSDQALGAIEQLRQIRNKAAHSAEEFLLSEHVDSFRQAQNQFGNYQAMSNIALKLMFTSFLHTMIDKGNELADELGDNPFPNFESCADYLSANSEIQKILEKQRPRWELALLTYLTIETIHLNFQQWTERTGKR